jgi:hypothetical protein
MIKRRKWPMTKEVLAMKAMTPTSGWSLVIGALVI